MFKIKLPHIKPARKKDKTSVESSPVENSGLETKNKKRKFPKFKKKKFLIVVGSIVLVVLVTIGVFAIGIYKYEWKDQATLKVASILNLPAFFVNGEMISYAKFEKYLAAYNTYMTEFYIKEEQKLDPNSDEAKKILDSSREKIKDLLVKDSIVRKEVAKRKIKYTEKDVTDSFNEFVKNSGGEEEIANNLKKYYGISVADFRSSFFMDAFLNGKIQNEISNDKGLAEEAKKKAESILTEIKKGADFAETTKKYSEDDQTASKGGDLGFIKKGEMVPQFEDAAFKLEVGKVSEVVQTVYGYHIIKLIEINGEERKVSHILVQARDFDWWLNDAIEKAKIKYWVK